MSILLSATKESKASLYRSSAFLSGICTIHFTLRSTCFSLLAISVFEERPGTRAETCIVNYLSEAALQRRIRCSRHPNYPAVPWLIYNTIFQSIASDKDSQLNKLLPQCKPNPYLLRKTRRFAVPRFKTDRLKNTFILTSSCINYK